ncbi:hypothetical protein RND81_12G155000 [Saponaria officinalis]
MDGFWVEDGGQAFTPRSYRKAKRKLKFNGWGSWELIDFLKSIGKDTIKPLSHYDVTNIVNQYVIDCKLIHPEKKKRVVCDERLQILFGGKKQSVFRNKIHDLLEPHLVANHVDSEDERYSSEENEDVSLSKRQKLSNSDKMTLPRKKNAEVPKSSLAAICPENIKLVYLKRSLVLELLRYPQTFESKVVGSYVKTKSDPYDIYQKNSHQLQLVTGVKEVASAGDNRSAMLQIAGVSMTEGVNVSALSDDDFSEEECEDLRRRFKDGLLKQPTVGELEQKAIMLHEDITKHWLARELRLLKIRTDQANEKGWRHRVMEYADRRKLLETPAEQSRLLNEIPSVLPEKVEQEIIPEDSPDCVNQKTDDLPKADDWDWEPCYNSSAKGVSPKVSSKQGSQEQCRYVSRPVQVVTRNNGDALPSSPHEATPLVTEQAKTENNGQIKPPMELNHISFGRIEAPRTESNRHSVSLSPAQKDVLDAVRVQTESNRHAVSLSPVQKDVLDAVRVQTESNRHAVSLSPVQKDALDAVRVQTEKGIDARVEDPKPKKVEVITLSDDEEEVQIPSRTKIAFPNIEHFTWHYLDPMGRVQGPFSLASLKRWSDLGYFQPGFRVWTSSQRPEQAVLLSNILQHVFPC